MTPTDETISGQLARFAAGLRYDDLPADVRERAQLVNGEWMIDSHPGQGATMTLAVPLHRE